MGYQTRQWKVKDHIVSLKMSKDHAETLVHRLADLYRLTHHCRELSGVLGVSESAHDYMTIGLPHGVPIRNADTYPADVDAWLQELSGGGLRVLTEADVPAILAKRKELYELHIPIKDTRKTPEAKAEQDAEHARLVAEGEAQRKAKHDAIVARFGAGQRVPVPADATAILLQCVYDNSDIMTDYFDRHAHYGPAFLLGVVPGKARQTEALARSFVARYPSLCDVAFAWKTETYSMGHGNYLESTETVEATQDITIDTYGGGRSGVGYEVQFEYTYNTPRDFEAYQGYPGEGPALPAEAPAAASSTGTPRLNVAKGGVEIAFADKPDADILARIKAQGWRWSKFSRVWYTKDSPRARAFAEELTGKTLNGNGNGHDTGPDYFDLHVEDSLAEAAGVR